ncbi:unnamed protein product [Heterobilharzia americana]|nr:unnamed protein product [Heterobilharzia americana]CAH8478394.1 unnamed protein product [Heterobilharzia americana]
MPSSSAHEGSESFFEPVVVLPSVTVSNCEENEECLFKERAQLFRFDTVEDPPQWKERGVGILKILRNKSNGCYRLLMRRDRTYKVSKSIIYTYTVSKAFVWNTMGDFSDETVKPQSLGVRFASSVSAQEFQKVFKEGCKASADKLIAKRLSNESTQPCNEAEDTDLSVLSNSVKQCLKINTADINPCDTSDSVKSET